MKGKGICNVCWVFRIFVTVWSTTRVTEDMCNTDPFLKLQDESDTWGAEGVIINTLIAAWF